MNSVNVQAMKVAVENTEPSRSRNRSEGVTTQARRPDRSSLPACQVTDMSSARRFDAEASGRRDSLDLAVTSGPWLKGHGAVLDSAVSRSEMGDNRHSEIESNRTFQHLSGGGGVVMRRLNRVNSGDLSCHTVTRDTILSQADRGIGRKVQRLGRTARPVELAHHHKQLCGAAPGDPHGNGPCGFMI